MPNVVVFTSIPAPPSRPVVSFQPARCTRAPNFFFSACARSRVRLITYTRPTSRWSNANTTARAPPPAPSTTAVSRPRSHPGAATWRLARKPSTSVFVDRNVSPSCQSVLAAPTARARSSGSDIAVGAQILDKRRKLVGWHRFTPILSIELVLLDPIVVNQWGTRMTGRPGDDTDSFVFFTHYFATLCCFGDRCM